MEQIKNDWFFFYDDLSQVEIKPNSLEHAYLAILTDDLPVAKQICKGIDSPRAHWAEIMIDILKDNFIVVYPTFFQIRNFFEIDMDFLLKNKKIDYAESLLGALELFSAINLEVYKFAGRVMFQNGHFNAAKMYMDESKKLYYNDPELHFLYAKYYIKLKNYKDAYDSINECLRMLPTYYPAKLLKEQIEQSWV